MTLKQSILAIIGTLVCSSVVFAVPPHQPEIAPPIPNYWEEWKVEFFDDTKRTHPLVAIINKLCISYIGNMGTHTLYGWYILDPNPQGTMGRATQEGDQVFMYGVYPFGSPNLEHFHSGQWELVSKDIGAGHWQFWNKDLTSYIHDNVLLTRTGNQCPPL